MAEKNSHSLIQALKKGPLKVSIIGSGNWGSVIARLVATNVADSYIFDNQVCMWVYEEIVDGRKLSEISNSDHENLKYLPGIKLPPNVVAVPDVVKYAEGADLYIFVLPHQFVMPTCNKLVEAGGVAPHAKAISLIKGLHVEGGEPQLFSSMIRKKLGIDCCVLSGANVAKNVAREEFCETTLGYSDKESAVIWQQLFDTSYFRVNGVPDVQGVEICGALKNVVALAAGFWGWNEIGNEYKISDHSVGV